MYIDPGFGSLLFQSVAAVAAACVISWTAASGKLKSLFRRRKSVPHSEAVSPEKADSEIDENGFLK